MWALANGTQSFVANSPPSPVASWYLGPPSPGTGAQDQRCRFEYSPQIMITICILNFIKATTMLFVWWLRKWQNRNQGEISGGASKDQILYTLGDAIASFMREPDGTTNNMCLATKNDFRYRRTLKDKLRKRPPSPNQAPRQWKPERNFWMASASLKRWVILILTGFLLGLSFTSLRHRSIPTRVPDLWRLGFGALTPFTYLVVGLPRDDPAGLISNVLLANLPQLILSILYIFYNTMLSTFLVQREWSLMHSEAKRKPLRVSEPIGIQRSSYFISLPLRYGIPLYAISGIMHWMISQSLFLARITALLNTDGVIDNQNSFSTCGYSPVAVFISKSLASVNPKVMIVSAEDTI
ncbi:hypothetical protein PG994_004492 [Apiospora phragmitis]|uniref:Uncharacterized protein n=1 Tax=Apiospora phragmitis TaxID=2905665 RepID=A0ABR1VUS1_9PEZI